MCIFRGMMVMVCVHYLFIHRLDYDGLCHRILSVVNSPNNNLTIINSGLRGGLGHKYYSLVESLLYALILGRNYKSDRKRE